MKQEFLNEQLIPGIIGQFLIVLAFSAALLASLSYFFATRFENANLKGFNNKPADGGNLAAINTTKNTWQIIGKVAYTVHTLAIIGVFFTLFYIIANHLFEYNYAWRHTSKGLQTKYLFAAFWEGSEGSFLLWATLQAVVGYFVMRYGKQWETRAMTVIALCQAVLCTLLLGIYITPDIKIGATPFTLLRNEMAAPIFQNPDYLSKITDGNGLNVLLQNYWMVIHPPVLFMGFALGIVPFAYSLAALWSGEYKAWVKPTLRWTLLASAILGLGIMMGAAWAYESLSFGGYWAWDPVENASLVPWLILIAGLHTLLIYKATGRSLKITIVFFILAFILIWYSTFLTRTGVLGDTSVHSFTGEGKALYWHLIIVLAIYIGISLLLLIQSWRKIPVIAGEEDLVSREFWMLLGSIIILLSSFMLILFTSLPVWSGLYKTITGIDIAPWLDPITTYNSIMVWAGIFIAILSGAIQFFKYKKSNTKVALIKLGLLAAISLVLTVTLIIAQDIQHFQIRLFGFSVIFTIVANVYYLFTAQKAKLKLAGGSITHFGFGVMMLGILISGYNKRVISLDRTNTYIDFNKETFEENLKESRENVLLFRNTNMPMGDFVVTYLGDSTVPTAPPLTYFKVKYDRRDPETNELKESFILYPQAYKKEKSANPDARHYLTYDVFTYINSFSESETHPDSIKYKEYTIKKGDTVYLANGYLVFEKFHPDVTNKNYIPKEGDIAVEAVLSSYDLDGKIGSLHPVFVIDNLSRTNVIADTFRDLGVFARIEEINPENETVKFAVHQQGQQDDFIVMKAIIFPYINLLWAGLIIMILGFFVSWRGRK